MSTGSLQINGNLGKYAIQTNNCALAVNQTALTIAGFIQVVSFTTTSPGSHIFTMVNGPLSNGFGVSTGGGSSSLFYIKGVNTSASYNWPTVAGQSIHFAMSMTDTGTAKIYINGVVKATATNIGHTNASTNAIILEWDTAQPGSVLLSDLAIWNGTQLTDLDIANLRDRVTTPATAATPATSWWTLSGTANTHPAINDAGLNDQIGINHFTSISSASGYSANNASYSATTLNFSPSITVNAAHVSRSGNMFFIHIGSNPAFGVVTPSLPIAINANPSFSINGTPVSVIGPTWSSSGHVLPWVAYQPYTPGSPPTPITVQPSDVVTWSTPSNWIQTSLGIAGAESGTAANYAGHYEPGVFTYMDFDPPAASKTFLPGLGGGDLTSTSNPPLNVLHRAKNGTSVNWGGALTSTADAYPLTVASGGTATCTAWSQINSNWIDGNKFPVPWGAWTLTADESNHSNPMTATLTVNAGATSLLHTPTIMPGTVDTNPVSPTFGWELHRRWTWQINQGTAAGGFVNTVTLAVTAPTGQTAVSLKNMVLSQGGDTPVDTLTPSNDISQNFQNTLSFGNGVACPYARWLYGAYPNSSWVDPGDLPSVEFNQTGNAAMAIGTWEALNPPFRGSRIIRIHAVQFYDLTVTPHVYSQTRWSTTPGVSRFVASSDPTIADWMVNPTDYGLDNSWSYNAGGSTNQTICQFFCADASGNPINHNLRSAQFVTLSTMNVPCSNSLGNGTCQIGGLISVWVTSASTFIANFKSTLTNTTTPGQIVGTNVIAGGGTATITVNGLNPAVTIEQIGATSQAAGNPGVWVTLNHGLSDAGVTAFAQRLRSVTAPGTVIIPQFSNEIFIPNNIYGIAQAVSSLIGNGFANTAPTVMQRTYEMQQIFRTVWGADSGSIRGLFQPWTVDAGGTQNALAYAQQYGLPVDMIAIAPYIDLAFDTPFKFAAAQMAADHVSSIANAASGNPQLPVLPIPGYLDILRHFLKYNITWNGANALIQQHINAVTNTGYGTGIGPAGWTYPFPKMVFYEGGVSNMVIAGVSQGPSATRNLRTWLSHDIMYFGSTTTTSWWDVIQAACQHFNQPGPAGTIGFASGCITTNISPRSISFNNSFTCPDGPDNNSCEQWGTYIFQGQPRGRGLSNLLATPSAAIGGDGRSHDVENQTQQAQSFGDWLTAASTGSPTAGTMAKTAGADALSAAGRCITGALSGAGRNDTAAGAGQCITLGLNGIGRPDAGSMVGSAFTAGIRVSPSRIHPRSTSDITLILVGAGTHWTGGSTATVTNNVTGTTNVTKTSFAVHSATDATLTVTTGGGIGTWKLTIDGLDSPPLVVGARRHEWFVRMSRMRLG
jgi:hypothetical protein